PQAAAARRRRRALRSARPDGAGEPRRCIRGQHRRSWHRLGPVRLGTKEHRMKLVRYGNPGAEKPGLVDDQGRLRDLSNVIADLTPANLSRSALQKIVAISPSTLPIVAGEPRLGVPIAGVGKFIAIGLNYADHAAEANLPLPSEPIVF